MIRQAIIPLAGLGTRLLPLTSVYYNVKFEETLAKSKFKFKPSNEIIKENEDLIIENMEVLFLE